MTAADQKQPNERRNQLRSAIGQADLWLERFRRFWDHRLDALGTEIARGKRNRRGRRP